MSSICGILNKAKGDLVEVKKYSNRMIKSKKVIEAIDEKDYKKTIEAYNEIYHKIEILNNSKKKIENQNKELNKGLDTKQPFNILNTILTLFKSIKLYNPLSSYFSENFLTKIISNKATGKHSILDTIVSQIDEIYSKTYKTSVEELRKFDTYKDMVDSITKVLEGRINKWLFNTESLTDPFKDVIEINKIINADSNVKINKVISSKLKHNIIHYKIEVTYQGPDVNGKFVPKTKVVNVRMSTVGSNGSDKLTYKLLDEIKDGDTIPLSSNSYINNAIISFFAIPVNKEKTKYILPPEMLKAMSLATAATLNEVANADKMLREKILKILFNDDDENRIMNMHNYTPKDINDAVNLVRKNGIPRQELITYLGSFMLNAINAKVDNSINATDGSLIKETIGAYALSLIVNNADGKIQESNVTIPTVNKNYLLYKLNPKNKLPEDSIKTLSTYSSLIQRLTGLSIGQPEIIPEGVETGFANNKVKGQEEYTASNEIMSFMNKEEEEVYNSNIAFKPFVNLPEDIALITMGGREESDILENEHVDNYEVELSKNDDYMRRREVILERQDLVEAGFKTKWRIVKNLRTMMDSIVNPQDNKVHRFLLKLKYAVNGEEYNGMEAKNDEDFKDFYYLALSQAFDMDPDKLTDKTVISNVKQKVVLEKVRNRDYVRAVIKDAELKEIVNGFIKNNVEMSKEEFTEWLSTLEGQKAKEQYINFIKDTEHMHAYLALIDLYHFTQTNAKTGPYHTQLTVESDAITSGMVLTILQSLGTNAILSQEYEKTTEVLLDKIAYYLFKAGVYTQRGIDVINSADRDGSLKLYPWDIATVRDKLNISDKEFKKDIKEIQKAFDNGTLTHGMLKEKYAWFNDFYETLAIGVTDFLSTPDRFQNSDKNIEDAEAENTKKSKNKANALKRFNRLTDIMLNTFPKEFKRSLVKPAQMVFTYGASIKNIINKMYYSIMYTDIKDTFNELGRNHNINTYQLLLMMYSIALDANPNKKDTQYMNATWYKDATKLLNSLEDKHKNTIHFIANAMITESKYLDNKFTPLAYVTYSLVNSNDFNAFVQDFFKNFSIVEYNSENRRTTTTQIKKYVQDREAKDNPMNIILGNVKLNNLIIPFSTKNKLNNTLSTLFDKVYGKAFRSVFNNYDFIVDYRNEIKNQSKITYNLTKLLLEDELELYLHEHGLTNKNQLTKDQHREIITNMIEKNNWYNYKSIQALATQDTYVPLDKTEKVSESRAYTFNSGKLKNNVNITPNTNEYTDNSVAAPVVTIHQIDSKMIVETLLKSFFDESYYVHTGHIFDALLMQLNTAQVLNTNFAYNKSTIHTNASYNVLLTAFDKNIHLINEVKKLYDNDISSLLLNFTKVNNPEFNIEEFKKLFSINHEGVYNDLEFIDEPSFKNLLTNKGTHKDIIDILNFYEETGSYHMLHGVIAENESSGDSSSREKELLNFIDTLYMFKNLNFDNPEIAYSLVKDIYKEFYDQNMVVGHNYISDNPNTLYINNDETKPINLLDKNERQEYVHIDTTSKPTINTITNDPDDNPDDEDEPVKVIRTKNGIVTIKDNFITENRAKTLKTFINNELKREDKYKHSNKNDHKKQTAIYYGPVEYAYSKTAVHPKDEMPNKLKVLAHEIEQQLGKPKGYFNNVLINKFDNNYGIGEHTDSEDLYIDSEGKVGDVAIISIGSTKEEHTFDGKKAIANDKSLVNMSTGHIKHSVGKANGTRYSLTFRHIPKSKLSIEPSDIQIKIDNEKTIGKNYVYNGNEVNTLRVHNKEFKDKHFGNPFGSKEYKNKAEIPTALDDTGVSVLYAKWLLSDNEELYNKFLKDFNINKKTISNVDKYQYNNEALKNRRKWILNEIKSKKLDNKTLLYYKDTGKTLNHAKVLKWIVDNYNKSTDNKIILLDTSNKKNYYDGKKLNEYKNNSKTLYVFGDNLKRDGYGRQAVIRDIPNSIGIATKVSPYINKYSYFDDDDFEFYKRVIDTDIARLINKFYTGNYDNIVIPFNKENGLFDIGTGLAKLQEKAPKVFDFLQARLFHLYNSHSKDKLPVNVWFGSKQFRTLSNLAYRPFTYNDKDYLTVKHAYQSNKSGSFSDQLMEDLIKTSIEQNPEIKDILLATGNSLIAHTQDNGHWGTTFPEILMNIRDELKGKTENEETYEETYNEEDIPFSSATKYMGTKTGESTINSAEEAENFLTNELLGSLTMSRSIINNFIKSTKLAFESLDKINLLHYVNTTFNRGSANLATNTIKLSSTINASIQSEAEIYMHEMLHMYSQLALNYDQDLRVVVKRLQKATLKHMKANNIDPETFFIPSSMTTTSTTKTQSRNLFYYALEGSPEEFLVIASTNNILNNYIKSNDIKVKDKLINNLDNSNVINRLINMVINTVNTLYNTFLVKSTPVDKQIEEVLHNSIIMTNELRKGNSPKKSKLDIKYESLTEFAVNKLFSKETKDKYKEALDNFIKAFVDGSKQLNKEFNRNYPGSEVQKGVKKISQKLNFDFEHFTRNLLKEVFIPNISFKNFYILFNNIMYNREVARKHVESDIISTINDLIGKDKDIGFKTAMTDILIKTDLIHLPFSYSYINRLLNDRDFTENEYTNIDNHLKDIIRDDRTYKAIINQAKALGHYMIAGKATLPNLQLNAENIANMLFDQTHSISKLDPSIKEEVTTNLDKYITLYALRYSVDNEVVGEWFNKNEKNSRDLFMLLKNNLKSYKDELFEDSSSGSYKVKGFIRPKRTTKYEYKYIPTNKLDFYKSLGYKEVHSPMSDTPVTKDTYVGKVILVRRLDISSNYTKGILEVTDNDILGTTLSEIMFNKDDMSSRNFINLMVQDEINAKPILNSSFDPSDSDKEYMIPLYAMDAYDFNGGTSPKIVDYRFGIPDSLFLNMTHDMSIDTAVANTISHDRLKINGRKFNAIVLDRMLEEYHKAEDKSEWIPLCSPAVASRLPKEMRDKYNEEYWAVLPKYTKNYIGNRVFYVNKWLQDDVFGYKDVNPENLGKTNKNPEVRKLSYVIGLSTKLWKDLIKLLKFPLVFNNSAVLIGNLSSNMMILLSYRPKPQLIKDFITKWKQLDAYQKTQEEINKLDLKIKSGIATRIDRTRIKVLRDKLSRNPMHEIVANGIIGSIIDDVTVDNITDFDTNLISSYIKEKNPIKDKKINSLLDTIFLTENSAISKQLLKIMQYTDGISKAIMYEEFQKQGQSKEEALINADALFINYSINESKYLKFLNDTGLFMFSKFLLQTPKELTKAVYKNPIGFLKTNVLDSFVDVPDIFESYDYSLWDLITNRQMDVISETINNINPIDKWGRLL